MSLLCSLKDWLEKRKKLKRLRKEAMEGNFKKYGDDVSILKAAPSDTPIPPRRNVPYTEGAKPTRSKSPKRESLKYPIPPKVDHCPPRSASPTLEELHERKRKRKAADDRRYNLEREYTQDDSSNLGFVEGVMIGSMLSNQDSTSSSYDHDSSSSNDSYSSGGSSYDSSWGDSGSSYSDSGSSWGGSDSGGGCDFGGGDGGGCD